jgi:hypothetical protein
MRARWVCLVTLVGSLCCPTLSWAGSILVPRTVDFTTNILPYGNFTGNGDPFPSDNVVRKLVVSIIAPSGATVTLLEISGQAFDNDRFEAPDHDPDDKVSFVETRNYLRDVAPGTRLYLTIPITLISTMLNSAVNDQSSAPNPETPSLDLYVKSQALVLVESCSQNVFFPSASDGVAYEDPTVSATVPPPGTVFLFATSLAVFLWSRHSRFR